MTAAATRMTALPPLYHSEKQGEREIKKMIHFLLLSVLEGKGTYKSRKGDGTAVELWHEG